MRGKIAVVVVAVALLSSARAERIEATARPAGVSNTKCMAWYQPVCGSLDNKRREFSNACFARAAGASDIAPGKCSPRGDSLSGPYPWPWPWKASAPDDRE